MLYNVVLVFAILQSESVTCIHTSPLFKIFFPFRSLRALSRVPCARSMFILIDSHSFTQHLCIYVIYVICNIFSIMVYHQILNIIPCAI